MSSSHNSTNLTIQDSLEKQHLHWSKTKLKIDAHSSWFPPFVKEGQIWWCQIGKNIGVEVNGRNKKDSHKQVFFRPVLILKKYNKRQALVIPLTESNKLGIFYSNFSFQGKISTAILSQARTIDFKRLSAENGESIGEVSDLEYQKIMNNFINLMMNNTKKPQTKNLSNREVK